MDPWDVELVVSAESVERRAITRDADRGLLRRLRRGVLVGAEHWASWSPEEQHVVRARALAAVLARPPVFSHFTAAALHGLPLLRPRLDRLHTTLQHPGERAGHELAGHVYALMEREVVEHRGLLLTGVGRTVVDVAGTGTAEEGVMVADAALAAGLPRSLLLMAVDLAGPRKSSRRIGEVVDFADAGGGSAAESSSRWTMRRLRVEPPVLQFPVRDARGLIGLADFRFPEADALGEVDGLAKYLDPRFAPRGAARKVYEEKLREDRMRACTERLARWGWTEGRDPRLLGPILARVGVVPARRVLVL